MKKIVLTHTKTTKRFARYESDDDMSPTPTLYVRLGTWSPMPDEVLVTLEPATAEVIAAMADTPQAPRA